MRGVRLHLVVCIILFIVALAGCGRSQPSAADGEKVIADKIASQSEGRIKLISFQKTNGQAAEVMGVSIYRLEYSAVIEFMEDGKWLIDDPLGGAGGHAGFHTAKFQPKVANGQFTWTNWVSDTQQPGTPLKRGQGERIGGVITFEKKENGWQDSALTIRVEPHTSYGGEAKSASTGFRLSAAEIEKKSLFPKEPGLYAVDGEVLTEIPRAEPGFTFKIAPNGEAPLEFHATVQFILFEPSLERANGQPLRYWVAPERISTIKDIPYWYYSGSSPRFPTFERQALPGHPDMILYTPNPALRQGVYEFATADRYRAFFIDRDAVRRSFEAAEKIANETPEPKLITASRGPQSGTPMTPHQIAQSISRQMKQIGLGSGPHDDSAE